MYANLTALSIAPLAVPAGENQGKLLISFLAHVPAISPFNGTYLNVSENLSTVSYTHLRAHETV